MYKSSSTGMKRERPSSSPPPSSTATTMSKRSRQRYDNNNDDSDDSPTDNRGGSRSGRRSSPRRSYDQQDYRSNRSFKEGRPGGAPTTTTSSSSSSSAYPYKVLCISRLHPKASDEVIRDTLYREFKRYGDISVKIVHEPDERVAFVYFRSAEDAREVKHSKQLIFVYDKPVKIEAAYESAPSGGGGGGGGGPQQAREYDGRRGGSEQHHPSGGSRRSPGVYSSDPRGSHNDHHHNQPHRYDSRYDTRNMAPPPPGPPPPMHYRDYNNRRDNMDYGRPQQQQHPMHYNRYPPNTAPPRHSNMPPPHHHHHDMQGPPHHHQPPLGGPHMAPTGGGPVGGPPGGPPGMRYENKKDKFPNYLHHVNPEEDPLATRTLFAGNLEVNITDEELRRIFGRYGDVEDIDIKRPPPGTGNAYAFVRFVNLDMSARAKSELSGQYIGKFQCKIGYGKMNPTTKIWIGGLGNWTTLPMLEREFDRFGAIKKIDWAKGEIFAYITYETIDAAQAAVKEMRGYHLGGPNGGKLRTDFADAGAPPVGQTPPGYNKREFDYHAGGGDNSQDYDYKFNGNNGKRRESPSPHKPGPSSVHSHSSQELDRRTASPAPSDEESINGSLGSAKTIQDVQKRAQCGWTGALILKNSSFPSKFYVMDGDPEGVEGLMRDEEGKSMLRITQRLRLDQSKLDDVQKRIQSSQSHGIFLSLPTSQAAEPASETDSQVQSRPLRNLVSYLKQKEAAGVISLMSCKDATLTGVLYAFPPCPFSIELIRKSCPSVSLDPSSGGVDGKEDWLVVVVIRGGGAN